MTDFDIDRNHQVGDTVVITNNYGFKDRFNLFGNYKIESMNGDRITSISFDGQTVKTDINKSRFVKPKDFSHIGVSDAFFQKMIANSIRSQREAVLKRAREGEIFNFIIADENDPTSTYVMHNCEIHTGTLSDARSVLAKSQEYSSTKLSIYEVNFKKKE